MSLLLSLDTFIVTFVTGALWHALAYLVAVGAMVMKTHNLHAFLNILG